ncbi:MAG TPA: CoA transferase [Usitatibacter sp.]|nr:CoA transferase [Usitatibacter sp.]
MAGPLDGVRVVDMTTVAMGPYATQILGDMGADVVKVESPEGDVFRNAAPSRNAGMGAAFLNFNRNKRSIALDLKSDEGKATILSLVARADVFVSNTRPQALRKLGLDYETLAPGHPRLVHCTTCGFSEKGPYGGRPAFDDVIQAMSGLAALQGHNNNDGAPEYVNTIIADKCAGLTATWAIAMALYERERSGKGQAIEVPMFETMVSFNLLEHLAGETFRPSNAPMGYERVLTPHRRPYRTLDGYIGLLPYTNAQWRRFFTLAGSPQFMDDARFATPAKRSENIDALYGVLAELVAQRSTDEWLALLADADIPIARVLSPDEVLEDPHLQATGFFAEREHPSEGTVRTLGIPVTFSRTPGSVRRLAPGLGEHGEEVRREIGGHSPDIADT